MLSTSKFLSKLMLYNTIFYFLNYNIVEVDCFPVESLYFLKKIKSLNEQLIKLINNVPYSLMTSDLIFVWN